jgi:hypothetical protein
MLGDIIADSRATSPGIRNQTIIVEFRQPSVTLLALTLKATAFQMFNYQF